MKSHLSALGLVYRALALFAAGSVALIVTLMPYHAFLVTWAGAAFGQPLLWKSWKEIVLAVAMLGLLLAAPGFKAAFMTVLRQRLTYVIVAYAGLHLLLAALYRQPLAPTLAGLMTNLRFLAIFLVAQLVVAIFPYGSARLRSWLARGVLVSSVIVAVLGILQVFVLPMDFLAQFGYNKQTSIAPFILVDEHKGALRAFSTLRGPNTLGMFLLLPLAMLAVMIARRQRRLWAAAGTLACIVALYLTGSRSAWLGALVTLAALAFALYGKEHGWRLTRRYGLWAMGLVIVLALVAQSVPSVRLAIFHSSPKDGGLTGGSTDKHGQATAEGIADALAHPLGRGPGQAGPASFYNPSGTRIAENYYVQIAQEVGLLGLALFVVILYYVARRLWRLASVRSASVLTLGLFASFWGIAVINLLLHGWADDPTALVWWGLAGLVWLVDNGEHERSRTNAKDVENHPVSKTRKSSSRSSPADTRPA